MKADYIGCISHRNCLLKYFIEGKVEGRSEMTGRRGRKHKQILDGFN
jgi:hypothetical protein